MGKRFLFSHVKNDPHGFLSPVLIWLSIKPRFTGLIGENKTLMSIHAIKKPVNVNDERITMSWPVVMYKDLAAKVGEYYSAKKNLPANKTGRLMGNRGGSNPRPSESQSDALTN